MSSQALKILFHPELQGATLILGFTGWMDGGEVSTGTVEYLAAKLGALRVAEIDPEPFYLMNFPGSMEVASLFRPHVKIEEGLVTELDEPSSVFYCSPRHNLVLFVGKEPNLRWGDYTDCMFKVIADFNVARVFFIGTVAGLVPHTREPRLYSSVSDRALLTPMKRHGCMPSNYEGPGSFVTAMTVRAKERDIPLATLVAEVPAYVQGKNLKAIDVVAHKLMAVADLDIDLGELHEGGLAFEARLNEIVQERPDLAEMVRKMEEAYDQALAHQTDENLKAWLERQGIRLD